MFRIALLCNFIIHCHSEEYYHDPATSYVSFIRKAASSSHSHIHQPYLHHSSAYYEAASNSIYDDHGNHYHYDYYPKYMFEYGVKDKYTGDIKHHKKQRIDDVVKGHYMLDEPDGTVRLVYYTADKHNGFRAIVHRIGLHHESVQKYGY